ncbi:hypothetical protein DRO66_09230 [Candidatus Bathyarchaeota archaeon]|nr:MAG: hypothetical protein DRO66_09230 [Candidatus Bathyarchaeota archaeon]
MTNGTTEKINGEEFGRFTLSEPRSTYIEDGKVIYDGPPISYPINFSELDGNNGDEDGHRA